MRNKMFGFEQMQYNFNQKVAALSGKFKCIQVRFPVKPGRCQE